MSLLDCTLMILAKAPRPGQVKTRLCPPCSPEQAADLAAAALADTLAAVAATPVARRVLVLDGPAGNWVPRGFGLLSQRGLGLDERLAAAFGDAGGDGPALLIGMDTPQAGPELLTRSVAALLAPGTGAVLGAAPDGGWWTAGLRRPDPAAFLGVPMSTPDTWVAQRRRLRALGLTVTDLPPLRDVDDIDDALAVAAECETGSSFAAAMRALPLTQVPAGLSAVGG